jgi:hypothetical protein
MTRPSLTVRVRVVGVRSIEVLGRNEALFVAKAFARAYPDRWVDAFVMRDGKVHDKGRDRVAVIEPAATVGGSVDQEARLPENGLF